MIKLLLKSICLFLLQLFILNNNLVFSQVNNLWSEINITTNNSENILVQRLKSRALSGKLTQVKLDKTVLNNNSFTISLSSFQNPVTFLIDEKQKLGDNDFTWYGRTKDKRNSAVFVIMGDKVSGNLQVNYKTYNVVPLDNLDKYGVYELVFFCPCSKRIVF